MTSGLPERTDRESRGAGVRVPAHAPGAHGAPMATKPSKAPLAPIVMGIAVAVLVHFGVGGIPAASGEAAWLRWLRVLADHPVRTALAAYLAALALRSRPPSP